MEENIKVNVGEGTQELKVVYESVRERNINEWNTRNYKLGSVSSIVDFIKRKGSVDNTVVFYNESCISIILDDSIQDRPQDELEYNFERSIELLDWINVLTRHRTQKQLVDFLKRREDKEVEGREQLIMNLQNLKFVTEVKGDYSFDDNGNISFMFKEKGKEGVMKLPNVLNITLPILYESDYVDTIEVELELIKPKSEDDRPLIRLECPKLKQHILDAIDHEVGILKTKLPEHLIIAGRP